MDVRSVTSADRVFNSDQKDGKDVFTEAVESIMIALNDIRPAIAAVITIRWSTKQPTVPPMMV